MQQHFNFAIAHFVGLGLLILPGVLVLHGGSNCGLHGFVVILLFAFLPWNERGLKTHGKALCRA